jgi:hypothetical protein
MTNIKKEKKLRVSTLTFVQSYTYPKYYKHLKKAAQRSHLGRQEWASFWQNNP